MKRNPIKWDSEFVLFLQSELKGLSVTTLIWYASKLTSHGRSEAHEERCGVSRAS